MTRRRSLVVATLTLTCAAALATVAARSQPSEPDLTSARAILLAVIHNGGEEVGIALYPRESTAGTYRGVEQVGWQAADGLPPTTWPDVQFPMELSVRVDEDELPDLIVLTLVYTQLADDEWPPNYGAAVDAHFYLTTAPDVVPALTLRMTSSTFHHPQMETRLTPHGMEVVYWEDIPGLRGGDLEHVAVWTICSSGAFKLTLEPRTARSFDTIDIDEDGTHEIIVHDATRFAERYGASYWIGELPHTGDILMWDGVQYSRAPAAISRPFIEQSSQDLVTSYLNADGQQPTWYTQEVKRLGLLHAIEDCYFWGLTGLGAEYLSRFEGELRDLDPVYADFAKGVDRVIAKWRTGSAWAGSAYGGQAGEK